MSDIGVFPPGALVWLAALAWCCLCLLALVVFLFVAWQRTRKGAESFARDRFVGYAVGAWFSGMVAGLSMFLINWSGSLGKFSRWLDAFPVSVSWLALIILSGPLAAFAWNNLRRPRRV